MKSTAKSISLMRELKDRLGFRISGSASIDTIREAFDADGYPMMFLSNGGVEATANACILIRLKPIDAVSKDIFGNANVAFTPHVMELSYENNGVSKPYAAQTDISLALFEIAKMGVKVNMYEFADGTTCTEAHLNTAVAAGPAKELDFDILNPLKGN